MRPMNVVVTVIVTLGLAFLCAWSKEYARRRSALRVCAWAAASGASEGNKKWLTWRP